MSIGRRPFEPWEYDAALDNPNHASLLAVEDSPYLPLFELTASLIPEGASVVELGCGTGRLAALLRDRVGSYLGLDFAERRLDEARRYVPELAFELADLRTDPIPTADAYVANEVLEHLEDDLALLQKLPRGALVVLSVPSFDTADHIRCFPVPGSAVERYGSVLRIDRESMLPYGDEHYFHVMRGWR